MSNERNAIFVDVDSLNVVIKRSDRFVAALSYADALERLSEVIPCLGPGYNIYLCMKPKLPGTGDVIVDELAIPGMPFTANAEELRKVLKFFRACHGVSDVYLCNWLHNYISQARVRTFDSVFYYGSGVAFVSVDDCTVSEFKWWPSQREFDEQKYVHEDTYGDLGLLDVDGFIAQYPEFRAASKAQLTATMPLVHCYKSSLKIETSELYEKLEQMPAGSVISIKAEDTAQEEKPEPIEDVALQPKQPVEVAAAEEDHYTPKKIVRTPVPFFAKFFVACACVVMFACGSFTAIAVKGPAVPQSEYHYSKIEEKVLQWGKLEQMYRIAGETSAAIVNVVNYCKNSEISLNIVGFEAEAEHYFVRYTCVSEEESSAFLEYLSLRYDIESTSDLGATAVNGVQLLQFSVMFH